MEPDSVRKKIGEGALGYSLGMSLCVRVCVRERDSAYMRELVWASLWPIAGEQAQPRDHHVHPSSDACMLTVLQQRQA